jgi:hypothetical protein
LEIFCQIIASVNPVFELKMRFLGGFSCAILHFLRKVYTCVNLISGLKMGIDLAAKPPRTPRSDAKRGKHFWPRIEIRWTLMNANFGRKIGVALRLVHIRRLRVG